MNREQRRIELRETKSKSKKKINSSVSQGLALMMEESSQTSSDASAQYLETVLQENHLSNHVLKFVCEMKYFGIIIDMMVQSLRRWRSSPLIVVTSLNTYSLFTLSVSVSLKKGLA
jgi:hypothetical protein